MIRYSNFMAVSHGTFIKECELYLIYSPKILKKHIRLSTRRECPLCVWTWWLNSVEQVSILFHQDTCVTVCSVFAFAVWLAICTHFSLSCIVSPWKRVLAGPHPLGWNCDTISPSFIITYLFVKFTTSLNLTYNKFISCQPVKILINDENCNYLIILCKSRRNSYCWLF